MNAPAAISGEFTTIKHVPSRKVYQLVIEVAEEAAQHAFDTLGMPGHGGHIALARLVEDARVKPEHAKDRTPFIKLPLAQQAAVRCNEPEFRAFLRGYGDVGLISSNIVTDTDAARFVRIHCKVGSRAEIVEGTEAGDRWKALEAEYFAQSRGRR